MFGASTTVSTDLESTVETFVDTLERRGPLVSIDELRAALDRAPESIRATPDFRFYEGVYYGRLLAIEEQYRAGGVQKNA